MKLVFFLIAFALVFFRFYHTAINHGREGNDGNIMMTGDNLYEKINWSGIIEFTDDETGIASISPGGCLKYVRNEKQLLIESDRHGKLSYEIQNGDNKLGLNEDGKKIVAEAVKAMIDFGFDMDRRIEKIYKRGGLPALLDESSKIQMDNVKFAYLNRAFRSDSLTTQELLAILKQVKTLGNDMDKQAMLRHFGPADWRDTAVADAWLNIVKGMGSDMDKTDAVEYFIKKGGYTDSSIATIIGIAADFGSDMDKANLISKLIERKAIPDNLTSQVLEIAGNFGSDMDKENMYSKLMNDAIRTDEQWISLTNGTAKFESDWEKSNMLVKIAHKMPKSDTLRAIYLKVARTIGSDADYGKAIKAVE